MTTDYASELLTGRGVSAPPAAPRASGATDYAGELLATPQSKGAPSLRDIANADTNDGTASFGTLAKASMVDDPGTKIRIFARARFPKLPEPEAVARYSMVEGEPVYKGDDGKMYRETPTGVSGTLKSAGASMVGNPFTTAGSALGGAVGAVAGAPSGPGAVATAAAGSALGAAGGKGIDKTIANLVFDEPQTPMGNIKAMGTESAFAAGGSVLGSGVAKVAERGLARDIGKVSAPAVKDITTKAAAEGIDLNPAQITNLPSLKGKFDVLATLPTSRDTIAAGAEKQAGQASAAAERLFGKISAREGLDETGEAARDAAKKIIDGIVKERSSKAAPLYKKAFDGAAAMDLKEHASLLNRPAMDAAAKKAVTLAANEGLDLADPRKTLQGLHYMKMALDDMIEPRMGVDGVGAVERRQLVNLKNQLLEVMDAASPDYKQARSVFAHFSPAVTSIKEGTVSKLAALSDESTFKAAQMVFGGNLSPKTVQRTGELFRNAGMGDQWDGMVRAYLQNTWEQAGKQGMTAGGAVTQAPRWQAMLWGNPQQKKLLEAAMEPGQKAAMGDLMEVFQAMARTAHAGAGSQTMGRQEAAALMRQDAGSGIVSQGAKLLSPQNMGNRVANFLDEVRLGKHAEKLAEVMTSPDGMKRLRELKRLAPGDRGLIQGAASLFGLSLAPDGSDTSQTGQR